MVAQATTLLLSEVSFGLLAAEEMVFLLGVFLFLSKQGVLLEKKKKKQTLGEFGKSVQPNILKKSWRTA